MIIRAVLFDLDGTLADTARDLLEAMNLTLALHNRPLVNYDEFRRSVAYGTNVMIEEAFQMNATDAPFDTIKHEFLDYYQQCIGNYTVLFDGIDAVLNYLDTHNIPWGIVTNKIMRFTLPLLQALHIDQRAKCIVAGDTTAYMKPHPEPLLKGCELLRCNPQETLYVGDYKIDVEAAKAAQMPNVIINNQYHRTDENPDDWQADIVVENAQELIRQMTLLVNFLLPLQ